MHENRLRCCDALIIERYAVGLSRATGDWQAGMKPEIARQQPQADFRIACGAISRD